MFEYSYIAAPLVGGVIGYITNALAIRMLFRPYAEKRIFGMKVPFTPGIIPKEKGRIAASLGSAISENLMSNEVLEKYLLSDGMIAKIETALDDFISQQQANHETLQQFILHYIPAADYEAASRSLRSQLTAQVARKLGDSSLGSQIADVVVEHVASKMRVDGLGINISDLLGRALGGNLVGRIADMVQAPLKSMLAKSINSMLKDKGPEIVGTILTNEISKLENTPVKAIIENHIEQIAQIKQTILGLYRKVISEHLPKILAAINIPCIIESRINEMDMKETEQLIFKVMDKELKALIWLGALLGMIMGCINLIF